MIKRSQVGIRRWQTVVTCSRSVCCRSPASFVTTPTGALYACNRWLLIAYKINRIGCTVYSRLPLPPCRNWNRNYMNNPSEAAAYGLLTSSTESLRYVCVWSYMSFRLVPKSVTLNDLERRNCVILRYFSKIGYDRLFGVIKDDGFKDAKYPRP